MSLNPLEAANCGFQVSQQMSVGDFSGTLPLGVVHHRLASHFQAG